ncbi:multicopper oxidase family protein [Tomitella gaofuii]|uniref:multicopper oxidase family protein n=1 Tax=Tomitella gaofuii TaxID=2760083 RepID=UPI0015FB7B58|nr:multicopper oxidase domain-containing protein [Tomitella gaofuii]
MPESPYPRITRRSLLRGAGGLVGIAAVGSVLAGCGQESSPVAGEGAGGGDGGGGRGGDARRALPVPPLLDPRIVDGVSVFSLVAMAGSSEIRPGVPTPTWGYNGSMLGPTLRARRGDRVRVEVRNSLPEMTTTHWHGMHLPAKMDGGPHQPIAPGGTWSPEWRVDQQAATLWYHPHPHGVTGKHVYRGLAGLFLVDDADADALDLPRDYGVDDIPLIVQDRRFHDDGTLDETDLPDMGLLGDTPVVNGITDAHFAATTRRVRFRILNGATMRVFNLCLSDGRPFAIIGSDGGLLDTPRTVENVYVSPGERVEIVVDLAADDEVTLRNERFADNLEVDDSDAPDFGLDDEFDLLTISGPGAGEAPGALPAELGTTLGAFPDTRGARRRSFDMEWFQINGKRMDISRVDEVIDHPGWEVWTVSNKDNWIHNFHVHDTRFRVLSLDRTSTTPMTDGWKDTILLAPGAVATLAVRFTDHTSARWPYMYHCHMLFHEDQGMMGQFVVVEPGGTPDPAIGSGLEHGGEHTATTQDDGGHGDRGGHGEHGGH